MRFKRHVELEKGKLDLTPLVDVVLLLLIFFMLTSSFMFPPAIKIDLPKAITSKAMQEHSLFVLTVTSENVLYLNDKPTTLKELELTFKQAKSSNRNKSLLIKADRRASLGRIVQIWDIAKQAEFKYINIATTEPKL